MPGYSSFVVAVATLIFGVATASAADPVLCFSDLTSGARTGNSDSSLRQTADRDGAIVTIWGKNLGEGQGNSSVTIGGVAARIYSWGNATAPADLYKRHGMQMICCQIAGSAKEGVGEIVASVGGKKSNALPFTVRGGKIYFVKTTGDNAAIGDWNHPWKTIPHAATSLAAGDVAYICDGVKQVEQDEVSAAVNLPRDGSADLPKALVAYPGATCLVGDDSIQRGFHNWASGLNRTSNFWTISKFTVVSHETSIVIGTGFRVVGNRVSAQTGSAPEGAIEGSGNNLFVLGNELTHVGKPGCSKLYHPIYISTFREQTGPRHPTESNREIAWNFIHDNNANRGINIYSEQASAAYMTNHRVHDNVIIDQVGDAILIGHDIVGENWICNNVIARVGRGPDPDLKESDFITHYAVHIDAGDKNGPPTSIHFNHNTIYDGGWANAPHRGASGLIHLANVNRYTLDFTNNIIVSTGEPYVSGWTEDIAPTSRDGHNLWFGAGKPPAWDKTAVNADPLFVNAKLDDFHLLPASPAIGAGIDAKVLRDFDDRPRTAGAKQDLGAYGRGG